VISEKNKLTFDLFAILVSRPVTEHKKTKVITVNKKSLGAIEIADLEGGNRSKHRFVVKDAAIIGYPEQNTLENAKYILALLCSLINPEVLFSPSDLAYGESLIEFGKQTSDPVISDGKQVTSTKIGISLSFAVNIEHKFFLEEQKILDLANRLIAFNPFSTKNKCVKQMNILGAIQSYRRALTDTDIFECYSSLFESFEKGVLVDNPTEYGHDFDCRASKMTGYTIDDIKELHDFNNRLKHALRHNNDLKELFEGENKIGILIKRLKLATDKVVLSRLN
jgi:hypothetical protein